MRKNSLTRLVSPSSIAVIGASATPGKAGHEMLKALDGFSGGIYPINPRSDEILGRSVFRSIADVPHEVDLAIVALPAQLCPEAVEQAVDAGVGAVMIISGGFAESGDEGAALQRRILDACQSNGVRLLGPNTSGFANPNTGLIANFAPGMNGLAAGPVAIISQSGAITLAMATQATDAGLGVSLAIGTGNGQDVSPADVIEHLSEDSGTRAIIVYLEGVADGRRLYEAIRRTSKTKAIIVYPVGKADIAEFAASHTGNLMGSWELKRTALEQAGAILVNSIEELIDAAKVFSHYRLEPNPDIGIGLLTGQAGPGMIISDYLRSNDVLLPPLQDQTVAEIDRLLPPLTFTKNPVDTGRPGESFSPILLEVSKDPSIDVLVTFALHEPAAIDPVKLMSDARKSVSKPIIFGTAGRLNDLKDTLTAIEKIGIPTFSTPNRTARAARYLAEDARSRHSHDEHTVAESSAESTQQILATPNEFDAKKLLQGIGIPSPESYICDSHDQAIDAFNRLDSPCVAKVVSPDIAHKTEHAGVHLNINSKREMQDALKSIDAIKNARDIRYLVETMAPPGLEMIIGAKRDASFGPSVLVGLGGTLAEALNDVSFRLAPLTLHDADKMLRQLRGAALLDGWRGSPPVDKGSLAASLVAIGRFMQAQPNVDEVEVNPLRVYPDGLLALDALIVVK